MFTFSDWIIIGIASLLLIIFGVITISDMYSTSSKVIGVIIEIVVIASMIIGCGVYNTHTESGKRHLKSWESETSGGINRTVTVFDIEGDELAKYTGKFDIEESSQEGVVKIKFDCEGKRHIIYAQTGTVLIDEN